MSYNPLFQITEEEVERLNQFQLTDILNRLLKAEGQKYGIPPLDIKTTLRINDPDGGVDARVEPSITLPRTSRIPNGLSVWQFKAGYIYPKKIEEEESQKSSVLDAISNGGSYCFVNGKGYSDPVRRRRENAVNHEFKRQGIEPKGFFLTAQDIADWISDHPIVAMHPDFGKPVHDELLSFEGWERLPDMRTDYIEFEKDPQRQGIIDEVVKSLDGANEFQTLRIAGLAGVGKTRLALEAIRSSEKTLISLYSQSPAALPSDFFSRIDVNKNIRLNLIVDECDYETALQLEQRAQRCGNRLSLITIGHDKSQPGISSMVQTHWLEPLDNDAMNRVVNKAVPSLSQDIASYIVKFSGGYVKLAVTLAVSIAKNPHIVGAAQLAELQDVNIFIQKLIPDQDDRKVMKALSLLRIIGIDDEVAVEGEAIAAYMGLDFKDMKRRADVLRRNTGLIIKRGRYRYVTPHILAVRLAAEEWKANSDLIVKELLSDETQLPTHGAIKALFQRLGDLGSEDIASQIVDGLLGPEGLFPTYEILNNNTHSRLFRILSKASPKAAAGALERLFGHLPRGSLLGFGPGRRNIVWALEILLWWEETFWVAARLLFKLADAENETIANNASGVWCEIFQTRLGGSPVPAIDRLVLVEEALENRRSDSRMIGVKAIENSLRGHEMRFHSADVGGYITPTEWTPKTWEEVWEYKKAALILLDRARIDDNNNVASKAEQVFRFSIRDLIKIRLSDEIIHRLQELNGLSSSDRRAYWDIIQQALYYEDQLLNADQKHSLREIAKQLMGDSYHDRLRKWISQVSVVEWDQFYNKMEEWEQVVISLADEGFANPNLVTDELDWLSSVEAIQAYSFGKRFGVLDVDRVWLDDIIAIVKKGGNTRFLASYLLGRSLSGDKDWVEGLLDQWVEDEESLSNAVMDASWRMGGSDNATSRIRKLMDKGWITNINLRQLGYGRWLDPVTLEGIRNLLEPMVKDETPFGTETSLSLLFSWLEYHVEQKQGLVDIATDLLGRPTVFIAHVMGQFYWKHISNIYLDDLYIEISIAIIDAFKINDFYPDDETLGILHRAIQKDPQTLWPIIGGKLLKKDITAFHMRMSLREWSIEDFPKELLIEWATKNKPDGPCILAELAIPTSNLAQELLIQFEDMDCIGNNLIASFLSGTYSGSSVSWLQAKLDQLRELKMVKKPQIQKWVEKTSSIINKQIIQTKQSEEEEDLLL